MEPQLNNEMGDGLTLKTYQDGFYEGYQNSVKTIKTYHPDSWKIITQDGNCDPVLDTEEKTLYYKCSLPYSVVRELTKLQNSSVMQTEKERHCKYGAGDKTYNDGLCNGFSMLLNNQPFTAAE